MLSLCCILLSTCNSRPRTFQQTNKLILFVVPAGAPQKVGQVVGYFLGLFLSSNVKRIFRKFLHVLIMYMHTDTQK